MGRSSLLLLFITALLVLVVYDVESQDLEWHSSKSTLRDLQTFSKHHASTPKDLKKHRKKMAKIVTQIIDRLKAASRRSGALDLKIKKPEYTGSAFEDVSVSKLPEFDVMLVMDGNDIEIETIPNQQGYALLKPKSWKHDSDQFIKMLDGQGYISAELAARRFRGEIQKIINDTPELKKEIKLIEHGTVATLMKVTYGDGTFEVDMVPTFHLTGMSGGDQWYVPKPERDSKKGEGEEGDAKDNKGRSIWRRSFSLKEKAMLASVDFNNNCRKQLLRILKVFRDSESTFKIITSYHFKTVLLHAHDDKSLKWDADDLLMRLMGLLKDLVESLKRRDLRNYFVQEINLLKDKKPVVLNNVVNRIRILRTDEKEFSRLLKKIGRIRDEL